MREPLRRRHGPALAGAIPAASALMRALAYKNLSPTALPGIGSWERKRRSRGRRLPR